MNKERLTTAGIDYDEGVARFSGRDKLYEKYLLKFFEDNDMGKLRGVLCDGDFAAAFDLTHDLKGVVGNLSIKGLYKAVSALVEALRANSDGDTIMRLYDSAMGVYQEVEAATK